MIQVAVVRRSAGAGDAQKSAVAVDGLWVGNWQQAGRGIRVRGYERQRWRGVQRRYL